MNYTEVCPKAELGLIPPLLSGNEEQKNKAATGLDKIDQRSQLSQWPSLHLLFLFTESETAVSLSDSRGHPSVLKFQRGQPLSEKDSSKNRQ